MTATSAGPSRRTRFFVRRSSFAAPVNSMKVVGAGIRQRTVLAPAQAQESLSLLVTLHGGQELLAAEHALDLLPPLVVPERFDASVGRIAGQLLHPEVAVGAAGDLRQVGDRQYLGAGREALQRFSDRMRRLAADAGVYLVEDDRLAAGNRSDRERDARKLAAR